MVTHYIEAFTQRYMGKELAVCGVFVDPASFSTEPTCAECQRVCADDEATYAALVAEPNTAPPVRLNTFDPLAGYTERKPR